MHRSTFGMRFREYDTLTNLQLFDIGHILWSKPSWQLQDKSGTSLNIAF